mgnify:CR=1 FL=1
MMTLMADVFVTPAAGPGGSRAETPAERYDRNWAELLQALRVLQTGTQILTGFLLAIAFQASFSLRSEGQRSFYLVLVVLSGVSAVLALAPVSLHRFLFRHHAKQQLVSFGHAALIAALATVSLLLVGVVAFVFDVVVGVAAAWISGSAIAMLIVVAWLVVPLIVRRDSAPKVDVLDHGTGPARGGRS